MENGVYNTVDVRYNSSDRADSWGCNFFQTVFLFVWDTLIEDGKV